MQFIANIMDLIEWHSNMNDLCGSHVGLILNIYWINMEEMLSNLLSLIHDICQLHIDFHFLFQRKFNFFAYQ